ncbi:hypothetical protein [Streptomyces sp. NPDC001978]|uniref:hypothetical protein n=1 Tax=Streptomyces sp. NPDC001978 TaxID=3364627 RepID=UPI00369AEFC7
MISEVELLGQLSPRTAGNLYVVASEPHDILEGIAFGRNKRFIVEDGLRNMCQAVVRAVPQAGSQALMLGGAVVGSRWREAQTLAQLRQILVTVALIQRDEHALDQTAQPRQVHLLSHPMMMSQARTRFQMPHTSGNSALYLVVGVEGITA